MKEASKQVLGESNNEVALGEVVAEVANEDKWRVLIVVMP